MVTRYRAWLNGQGLQDVDPAVIITDIEEHAPEESVATAANALRPGMRVISRKRESLSVTIRYMIREYDAWRRKRIHAKVMDWAQDGWLTISDRPDQRLFVLLDGADAVPSALRWTDKLSLTLTAYAMPYWQERQPVTVKGSGADISLTIRPVGSAPCLMEGSITNDGTSTINALTIAAGESAFSFVSLGLVAGETLSISYDEQGILSIRRGEESALAARTAESSDDLWLKPGANTVQITADQPVSATMTARGMWK